MSDPPTARTGRTAVFVIPSLAPYGAERVLLALAAELTDVAVTVATVAPVRAGELELPAGVERVVLTGGRGGLLGAVGAWAALARLLRSTRPDVVVGFMVFANLLVCAASALAFPRRVVLTEHNETSASLLHVRWRRLKSAGLRLAYRRADAVVAVSRAVADDLLVRFGARPQRVHVVHNPVDVERLRAALEAPPPHPWMAPGSGRRVLVCVAALKPAKGQIHLLRAMHALPDDVCCLLVGDGDQRQPLERYAVQTGINGRVHLVGYADAAPYLRHAALLVLPSHYEGFGLVLVEAAYLGCPVVASAVGGPLELVGASVPGELVRSGDEAALAAAVERGLTKPTHQRRGWLPEGSPLHAFAPTAVAARYRSILFPSIPETGVQC